MHLSVYSQYGINLTQSLTSSFVSRIDPSCTEIHLNNNILFFFSLWYNVWPGSVLRELIKLSLIRPDADTCRGYGFCGTNFTFLFFYCIALLAKMCHNKTEPLYRHAPLKAPRTKTALQLVNVRKGLKTDESAALTDRRGSAPDAYQMPLI